MGLTSALTDLSAPDEVEYPSGDWQPMAETELHFWIMVALAEMLREYFRPHADVHVAGNVFLYYGLLKPASGSRKPLGGVCPRLQVKSY